MLEFQKCENVRVVPGLSNILKIKCVHISYYVNLGEGEGLRVSFRYLKKSSGKGSKENARYFL